ncbi:aromatic amino acid transport family protein [Vibrio amylolyticus]|uniref:aromatic amino acid transport family protein n=1 Tax=Vibrio amylolyticus TaxID=2847292 RepID=UPI003551BE56
MNKSKIFGSTLIIAGTTIGAGMLALPIASAGIGFTTSLIIMLGLWALMAFTALLMLELHQHADKKATLHTLAKEILGKKGQLVTTFSMLFLFYSLCAAYIAGGGAQFTERLTNWTGVDVSQQLATILFTLIVGAIVTFGTHAVDKVNRLLFISKLIAMVIVLSFLAPNVTQSYLLSMPVEQGFVLAAIPVIFTSFGFHGSIPAVVNYLDGNTRDLRKAIIVGSSIPLIVYIFWQIVTLGVISQSDLVESSGLSSLLNQLSLTVQESNISQIVGVFADLALLTSFLGVSLGLFEFLADSVKTKITKTNRSVATLITFLPPLGFALFYPQGFIMALGYAAIALAVLAIFLPIIMVYKVRKSADYESSYQVIGGQFSLTLTGVIGLLIVFVQIAISVGVLPALG